ncbi:MAG: hypothetical protein IT428_26650 [Planctomycetaceae bacterium]|nr:hypothetical protein [Planctomycetaceae bacterium]
MRWARQGGTDGRHEIGQKPTSRASNRVVMFADQKTEKETPQTRNRRAEKVDLPL